MKKMGYAYSLFPENPPFFCSGGCHIIQGDCREELKKFEDKSVDFVFTSPPYNRIRNDKYDLHNDKRSDWLQLLIDSTDECLRVSRGYVVINIQQTYFNKVDFYTYLGHYADKICGQITWVKPNGQPSTNIKDGERSVSNSTEFFFFLHDTRTTFKSINLGIVRNYIIDNVNTVHFNGHHAVMKYEVAEKIISDFTHEGDIVLDPFFGLGTTGVACKKLNRQCVGIELYEEYCEEAKRRIDAVNK